MPSQELAQRELRAIKELQQIVQELYALAPVVSTALPAPTPDPPNVQQVLAGLGYIVALQNAPEIGRAVSGCIPGSVLDGLLVIVREWLLRQSAVPAHKGETIAGFFQRTGEHVQRLRTLPDPIGPQLDGKGD